VLNVVLTLLTGAVAGGMATGLVRVVRRERACQRAQVQAWDRQWAAYCDPALVPGPSAASGPVVGESVIFRVPAPPAQAGPVVVDAVVVDQASERVR
jgi:hypothetical protein